MQITPSSNVIGAEVTGANLAELSGEEFARLEAAFNEHSVLSIRDQHLSEPQLIAFARRFGDIERNFLAHYAHPKFPEILLVSNIRENGRDIGHADAGRVWHTDMSFTARPPRATMLYALEVPVDDGRVLGDTLFSSSAAAHDSLPAEKRERIANLRAIHQVAGRRAKTGTGQEDQALRTQQPSVVHPVVRTHPRTGRKCLYVIKGECEGIEGMPKDEALALIDELAEHTVDPQFRYIHRWRVGDLLLWDNCAVQHLASHDYEWPKHRRLLQRITVGGAVPV